MTESLIELKEKEITPPQRGRYEGGSESDSKDANALTGIVNLVARLIAQEILREERGEQDD